MVVPQEAIIAAREQHLRRSSLKAAAIRRGELKISAPLPITVVDDGGQPRQPPSAHSMASFHTAHGQFAHEKTSHGDFLTVGTAGAESAVRSTRSHDIPRAQSKGLSMQMRKSTQTQRFTSPREPVLSNVSDPLTSIPSRQSRMEPKKQRKNGSLRTVLRKVFGRKSKQEASQQQMTPARHGYHRSVRSEQSKLQWQRRSDRVQEPDILPSTAAKREVHNEEHIPPTHQRVFSMPEPDIVEITSKPAPAMHLPFPMNVNAPEVITPPLGSYGFEASNAHRRRATLPSLIISPTDAATLKAMWSTSAGQLGAGDEEVPDKGLVGRNMSVTDTSGSIERRRSRSADALQELAKEQDLRKLRRRSAGIRYWRESFVERPISIQNTTAIDVAPSTEAMDDMPRVEVVEYTNAVLPTQEEQDEPTTFYSPEQSEQNAPEDPEPTSFLEPAESPQPTENLEQRVAYLESSNRSLETSLLKLAGRNHRQTIILENAPRGRRPGQNSRQSSNSSSQNEPHPQSRKPSSTTITTQRARQASSPSTADTSSPRTPPIFPSLPSTTSGQTTESIPIPSDPDPRQPKAPASATSLPTYTPSLSTLPSPSMYDQLAPLYNALRYERSARKALEAQVVQLQHDLFELNSLVRRMAGANAYPTPSPEQTVVQGSVKRGREREEARRQTSRFSGFDSEDEEEEEEEESDRGRGKEEGPLASPEVFLTPMEERRPFGFGPPLREGERGGMF